MRILFSFITAFLFNILAADMSSAQMMEHSCQEDRHMGGAMEMANCSCAHATRVLHAVLGPDAYAGTDHCPQPACSGSPAVQDVALGSTVSLAGFSGMVQNTSFVQPLSLAILGAHRTGLPPPRLSFPPAYLRNCSFLI